MNLARVPALAAILAASAALADGDMPQLRFSAGTVEYGGHRLDRLEARLESTGEFSIAAGGFESADRTVNLGPFAFDGELREFSMPDGEVRARGLARYEGLETGWDLSAGGDRSSLCLQADARPLEALAARIQPLAASPWVTAGKVDACLRYGADGAGEGAVSFDFAMNGLSFDSPDGLYAGEGLSAELHGEVSLSDAVSLNAHGVLNNGAILLDRFYGDFSVSAVQFSLEPEIRAGAIASVSVSLRDEGAVRAEAEWVAEPESGNWTIDIRKVELRFPGAYDRYIEAVAAAWTLDGLAVTGAVNWSGSFGVSGIQSGNLDIIGLSVVDTQQERFALTGLNTSLRPGDYAFDSAIDWQGLLLGRINLGPGSASLDAEPGAFALASPLELDVLGGRLRFDRLRYALPGSPAAAGGASRFEMEAGVEGVDVDRLTQALGWPRFSGRLSGRVPGVRLEGGVLSADGEVRVAVFGGEIVVSDLEAERPFGVLPSVAANIALKDLDLEQLTDTFEFGRIAGRIDGRVEGLRLLDWEPVAFDAWIGTPERQGKSETISRQAVQNLTNIGGGGATAALTSPIMRMFKSFSYRRLGLGCLLRNYVCEVGGISDDGDSVLLLEGAGIPKITVKAWNRRVDWPQMLANLSAIGSGGEIKVGDAPQP